MYRTLIKSPVYFDLRGTDESDFENGTHGVLVNWASLNSKQAEESKQTISNNFKDGIRRGVILQTL